MALPSLKKAIFCLVAILLPFLLIELFSFGILRIFFSQAYQEGQGLYRRSDAVGRTDYRQNDFSKEDYDYSKDFFGQHLHDTALMLPQRLIGPQAWSHYARLDHYSLFPFTMFHFQRNYRSAIVNTNSLGFRARELSAYVQDPRPKILLLGGSAVFGTNLTSDEKTISAQLEAFLRRQGLDVVCLNLAMGGYTSEQEMINLGRIGLRFNPAMVIALDGYNDVVHSLRHRDVPHLYPRLAALFHRGIPPNSPVGVYLRELVGQWGRYSSFFFLAGVVSAKIRPAASLAQPSAAMDDCVLFPEKSIQEAIVDNYVNAHTVMAALCKSRQAGYIAGLQPVCGMWVEPRWEGEKAYDIRSDPTFVDVYKLLDAELHALAKRESFPYLNIGKLLAAANNEYNFSDVVHLTDQSAGIIARRLGEIVLHEFPEVYGHSFQHR